MNRQTAACAFLAMAVFSFGMDFGLVVCVAFVSLGSAPMFFHLVFPPRVR